MCIIYYEVTSLKNVIDEDNIIRLMDKIKLYEKELKNNYNRIEQELTNIDNYYLSNNSNQLKKLKSEIINKFYTFRTDEINNEKILSEKLRRYIDARIKSEILFNNIER